MLQETKEAGDRLHEETCNVFRDARDRLRELLGEGVEVIVITSNVTVNEDEIPFCYSSTMTHEVSAELLSMVQDMVHLAHDEKAR